MEELFPDDPLLEVFASRYSSEKFDPVATRIIVSPAVQLRPKGLAIYGDGLQPPFPNQDQAQPRPQHHQLPLLPHQQPSSVRETTPVANLRREASPRVDSPKRPYPGGDDDGGDYGRPRKMARGDSPLKGAAGRRLDQQRRNQAAPLDLDVSFLLSILPPAHQYDLVKFSPHMMVDLLRNVALPGVDDRGAGQGHARQSSAGDGEYGGGYGSRRDSPNPPSGRPRSPYDGQAAVSRIAAGTPAYRNSPLRQDGHGGVGGGGGYETVSWPSVPGQYGVPPPHPAMYGRPSW